MIISGFPGVGKTNLVNKYENVIDLDGIYIFDLTEEQKKLDFEKLKGIDKPFNKNWPFCYLELINTKVLEYDIVLICQEKELLKELNKQDIDYITVFPKKDCIEDYMKRYRQRGNSEEYINKKRKSFYNQIEFLYKNTKKHWILEEGEFLEDRLIREKIYLRRKER